MIKTAIKCFKQAIAEEDSNSEAWAYLAACCLQLEDPQEAIVAASRAASLDPFNAFAWAVQGFSYLRLEHFEAAKQSSQKALELDACQPIALAVLGAYYHQMKEIESAKINLDKALLSDQSNPFVLVAYMQFALDQKIEIPKNVLEIFLSMTGCDSFFPLGSFYRGQYYLAFKSKHLKTARSSFKRAVTLAPRLMMAWSFLADIEYNKKNGSKQARSFLLY